MMVRWLVGCTVIATVSGVTTMAGLPIPTPDNGTVSMGLCGLLVVRLRVPVAVPAATGVNVTSIACRAPVGTMAGCARLAVNTGLSIDRPEICSGAQPKLITDSVRTALFGM